MKQIYLILFVAIVALSGCSTLRSIPRLEEGQVYRLSKTLDLRGQDWHLPTNSILECSSKGLVKNGRIIGDKSETDNLRIEDVTFSGLYKKLDISLQSDVDSLCYDISGLMSLRIDGNGYQIRNTQFGIIRSVDIDFQNVTFDCSNCQGTFLYAIGNGKNMFSVKHCRFVNIPEIELLVPRNMLNPSIQACEFQGRINEDARTKAAVVLNRFYSCKGNIRFEDNKVENCFGIAVDGIGYSKDNGVTVSIKNNTIANVSNGGIVFNGGEVTNVIVENNTISNVFCFGPQFDGEGGHAENAAINFHGFHNLEISHNTITNCSNSLALDLDGTSSDGTQDKGKHLNCYDNTISGACQSYLFGVEDADIHNNTIEIADQPSASSSISAITLNACSTIKLYDNDFRISKPTKSNAYPILVRQNTNRQSGKIEVYNNTVESDSKVYLMIYDGFTGEIEAKDNNAKSIISSKPLMWVNNSKSKGIRVQDENIYR